MVPRHHVIRIRRAYRMLEHWSSEWLSALCRIWKPV